MKKKITFVLISFLLICLSSCTSDSFDELPSTEPRTSLKKELENSDISLEDEHGKDDKDKNKD